MELNDDTAVDRDGVSVQEIPVGSAPEVSPVATSMEVKALGHQINLNRLKYL